MVENPLVSVITIFLNEEKFIREAIDSVLAQTYENWELILVDDGSTDESRELAQAYAEKHSDKVHYLEHPDHQNKGMSASRNLALEKAKGKYITFIDGDDYWLPEKLKYQVANLQDNPKAVMVCSPAQLWYSWTEKPEDRLRDFVQEFPMEIDRVVEAPTLFNLYLTNEFFSICDFIIRKDIVESVGGYEDSFRGMYEDQVFHSKVCLKHPVFISKESWYRYRRHPGSCTHESLRSADHQIKRKLFLEWLEKYLDSTENSSPEVRACFDQAIWPYRHTFLAGIFGGQPNKKNLKRLVDKIGKAILPKKTSQWLFNQFLYKNWPPTGYIRLGSLRRLAPFSNATSNRGKPIDQYYTETFLIKNKDDIQGHVLEMGDAAYTWKIGEDRVSKGDVLTDVDGNPSATIVGDLTQPHLISANTFDCIIITQPIVSTNDIRAVIQSVFRILKPGGVLLISIPYISKPSEDETDDSSDFWRFTKKSLARLVGESFPNKSTTVQSYGNILSATGHLYGMGKEELKESELDHNDPQYPVIISLKTVKPLE